MRLYNSYSMSNRKPIPLYALRPYGWSEKQSPLHCLLFYEKYLLIGSGDGQIFWYNLRTLRPEQSYLPNLRSPCLQLLRSGSYLISQSKAGEVSLWIQREGDSWVRENETNTNHSGFCRMQALEVGGVSQAVGCATGRSELDVYSVGDGKLTRVCRLELADGEGSAAGVVTCFSAVGTDKVVTLHEANVMHLWDIRQPSVPCHSSNLVVGSEEVVGSGDCEGSSVPVAVDFDIGSRCGVYAGMTDALGVFATDGRTLKHVEMKYPLKMTNRGALSVVVQRPEFAVSKSRIVAVGCCDGTVRVYSWSTGRPLAVLPHGDGVASVQDVAFSAGPQESLNSERVIAAAGADSRISIWSADFTVKAR